jgi:hypothetical protein
MAESLEERFKKAVWLIRNGPKMDSSNEQKLTFYSYFKQACWENFRLDMSIALWPLAAAAKAFFSSCVTRA